MAVLGLLILYTSSSWSPGARRSGSGAMYVSTAGTPWPSGGRALHAVGLACVRVRLVRLAPAPALHPGAGPARGGLPGRRVRADQPHYRRRRAGPQERADRCHHRGAMRVVPAEEHRSPTDRSATRMIVPVIADARGS